VRFYCKPILLGYTLKNNTEVTNSKCYDFASSALLRLRFTSNFKKDKYLATSEKNVRPPPPRLCWAGYGSALVAHYKK